MGKESDFYEQLITKAVTLKVDLRRFLPRMMKSMINPSPCRERCRVAGVPLHLLNARLRKLEPLEITESWNSIKTEVVALREVRVVVEAEKCAKLR